jgi:hypothetical protein
VLRQVPGAPQARPDPVVAPGGPGGFLQAVLAAGDQAEVVLEGSDIVAVQIGQEVLQRVDHKEVWDPQRRSSILACTAPVRAPLYYGLGIHDRDVVVLAAPSAGRGLGGGRLPVEGGLLVLCGARAPGGESEDSGRERARAQLSTATWTRGRPHHSPIRWDRSPIRWDANTMGIILVYWHDRKTTRFGTIRLLFSAIKSRSCSCDQANETGHGYDRTISDASPALSLACTRPPQ